MFAGLANSETVDIQPGSKNEVVITTSRPKNVNKPALSKHSYTTKKSSKRAAGSVGKQIKRTRPDLQVQLLLSCCTTMTTWCMHNQCFNKTTEQEFDLPQVWPAQFMAMTSTETERITDRRHFRDVKDVPALLC